MSAAPLFEPGAGAGTVDAVLQARELEATIAATVAGMLEA